MLKSGIRDNHGRGKVGAFLHEKICPHSKLSIISAYFTIYAFEKLKKALLDIDSLRFLFGEPRFVLDPERDDKKSFDLEDSGLYLSNRLSQKFAAKQCADWISQKVEIKSVKQVNLLHGKMYHIDDKGVESAILGSSNFTVNGLGLGDKAHSNLELNLIVDSLRDIKDLKCWFDEIWHDENRVKDVKKEVLEYLSRLYSDHTPQFIYYKTLYHLFKTDIELPKQDNELPILKALTNSQIWQHLFSFQQDGSTSAINKILKHGGCILADSVGLGKTYEALAVIKYFELRNAQVLVLCPKKLSENWTVFQASQNSMFNPFAADKFQYHVLAHTDLVRHKGQSHGVNLERFNWSAYDLVVIDESHHFRNSGNRYAKLMENVIKAGGKTKVLLLSATPVNTDLSDLHQQIRLITAEQDGVFNDSLGISSIQQTLRNGQKVFSEWASQEPRHSKNLLEKLNGDFFSLLDELTIARSRQHILRYYPQVLDDLGGFPRRAKPEHAYVEIDLYEKFMSYEKLNEEISDYKLALYKPSSYLLENRRDHYQLQAGNFSQIKREGFLIGMMKINFLKRLESSIYSFSITMERTVAKIDTLIDKIEQFQTVPNKDVEIEEDDVQLEEEDNETLEQAFEVGKKIKFKLADIDLTAWLSDLRQDREKLAHLSTAAKQVEVHRDAKLARLKQLIHNKITQPTIDKSGQKNRKVLIFTAFADTADYLYDNLVKYIGENLKTHIAMVSGTKTKTTLGDNHYNSILLNFSPRAKQRQNTASMPQHEEIDVLIATDCISEGQNLQDCDVLINYDIHWNPVRLIQRFGRIDRIGSLHESVKMINFWATPQLEQYLNLKVRVESRMALVDITATGADNIFGQLDEKQDMYRDQQLKKMLEEDILDLEAFQETVTLTAFSLDEFRADLGQFTDLNRDLLAQSPLGLYALVPAPKAHQSIGAGVIFCLQQKISTNAPSINPLQPYFLIYVGQDGKIRHTFAQPKHILDILRELCVNADKVYEALCSAFDQETNNGEDMTIYNTLLDAALHAIEDTFQQRAATGLQSGRGGLFPEKHAVANKATDFTLITWLIIK